MRTEHPTISLCMIAKDEEDWIGECIRSALPIVSEVILVDTGSSDRTVEIARGLGAEILFQAWEDDFSKPRNLSLERAHGDWILVLDADEVIDSADYPALLEQIRHASHCYEMKQRHYTNDPRLSDFEPVRGEKPAFERHYGGYFESGLVRLFPNGRGVRYVGRIHELVEYSIPDIPGLAIVKSPVRIHHYGHTEEVKRKKNKAKLYTPLGETKVREVPENWKAYFELGVEHNCNLRYRESIEAFLRSVELNPSYGATWVNLGYVFCQVADYRSAVDALSKALRIEPNNSEAYCNLSVVYLRLPQFATAEKYARMAVNLNPKYVNAMCNLGKAIARQGRAAEAALVFERALELFPQCTAAKLDLGALHVAAKNFAIAERLLADAAREIPDAPEVQYNLGQLYKGTNRAREAVSALEKFCALTVAANSAPDPNRDQMLETIERECRLLREQNP